MTRQPENFAGARLGALQRQTVLDPLDWRVLLCHVLNLTRAQLISQSERILTSDEARLLADVFRRRINGEPIAYITGEREFYGLSFRVTPDALIPRPETELLVECALERLPQGANVLDMGTGSGAIAVAIAHARPDIHMTALDASPAALTVAQENAHRILAGKAPIRFLQSDWFAALAQDERFDLIVSNPPYIASGDPHLSQGDLRFEPTGALTDQADGLSALRTIVLGAPKHLKPKAWLLMEHGFDQATQVKKLLYGQHFEAVQTWTDLAGRDRVTGGKWRV